MTKPKKIVRRKGKSKNKPIKKYYIPDVDIAYPNPVSNGNLIEPKENVRYPTVEEITESISLSRFGGQDTYPQMEIYREYLRAIMIRNDERFDQEKRRSEIQNHD